MHDIDGTMARQFRDVRRCVNFEIDDTTVAWRCWKVDSATEEKREVDKEGDGVDVHLWGEVDREVSYSALLTISLKSLATNTPFPRANREA